MAYSAMTDEQVDANSPINETLMKDKIKNNDDDHETRLNILDGEFSSKSSNYTITDTDGIGRILGTTGSSSNLTITLPTAADNSRRVLTFIKVDSGTKYIEIAPEGSEEIRGSNTSIYVTDQYEQIKLVSDGTEWHLLSNPLRTIVAVIDNFFATRQIRRSYGDVGLSLAYNDAADVTITFGTGVFSEVPYIVSTVEDDDGDAAIEIPNTYNVTQTSFRLRTLDHGADSYLAANYIHVNICGLK